LGHPHQCQAGHRWQHAGPTAVICLIPVYDSAGDLMRVGPEECPVCSSRDDVLVRGVHTHYCSMCDGDWDHEGRCPDGLPLGCPWCFPKEVSPAPGARTGSHFHCCPACGMSWRHINPCSAPFDAVLPDCSGCIGLNKREHRPTPDRVGRRHHLVRRVVVTGSLAASVFLATSFVATGGLFVGATVRTRIRTVSSTSTSRTGSRRSVSTSRRSKGSSGRGSSARTAASPTARRSAPTRSCRVA